MVRLHMWYLRCIGNQEVHVAAVEQLPVVVIVHMFVKRSPYALCHTTIDLPLNNKWVDQFTTVMQHHVLPHFDDAGMDVNLDNGGMNTARKRGIGWAEVPRGF